MHIVWLDNCDRVYKSMEILNTQQMAEIKPYGKQGATKKEEVTAMFNKIAPRYDLLNHLLSMGIDKGWRKKAVSLFRNNPPSHLLDVATGTADFAITALSVHPGKITGVDI